jgi:NAD(P)H-dependent FMN reductase
MHRPLKLALVYGSTRPGRFADTVARWAADRIAQRDGFALDIVDPAQFDLPIHHDSDRHPGVAALRRRLDNADAFVILTPEYNHAYPAILKHVIDLASGSWRASPVAFISYGGLSGGLRAVEQLRPVFAEVHAVTVRDTFSLANVWDRFDADGALQDAEAAEQALERMLDQLEWWALALVEAERVRPYGRPVRQAGARLAASRA